MLVRSKYQQLCDYLTLTILLVIVVGIPCSNILMSLGGIALAALFLISPKLVTRAKHVFHEPYAMFALALFAWHIVGLLWTTDIHEGIRDIRIKLPILLFPLALSGIFMLTEAQKRLVIRIYLLTVLTNTFVLFGIHQNWYGPEVGNFRDLSLFISHIRLSLNICFAIGLLWLYPNIINTSRFSLLLKLALSCWAIYFLSILESGTSMLIAGVTIVAGLLYLIKSKTNPKQQLIILSLLIASIFVSSMLLTNFYNSIFKARYSNTKHLAEYSANNKQFTHHNNSQQVENGYFVNQHIIEKELTQAWFHRTNTSLKAINKSGYETKANLLRYLTSRGLTKDSIGLSNLSDEEIKHIQQGATNYRFVNSNGFVKRLYAIMFEWSQYKLGQSPNGHSMIMRFEFIKAGLHILRENWLLGVGTGDLHTSFQKAYTELESKLDVQWRHRAHNQYLSIWLALGVIGIIIFLGMVFSPIITRKNLPLYTWYFVLIATTSFLTEDTLETQAGVTFVMFFMSFLYVGGVPRDNNSMLS